MPGNKTPADFQLTGQHETPSGFKKGIRQSLGLAVVARDGPGMNNIHVSRLSGKYAMKEIEKLCVLALVMFHPLNWVWL